MGWRRRPGPAGLPGNPGVRLVGGAGLSGPFSTGGGLRAALPAPPVPFPASLACVICTELGVIWINP